MKLRNILPVAQPGILGPDMEKYLSAPLHDGTTMDTKQITEGALSIESSYDEVTNDPYVLQLIREAKKDGIAGCFINCFGDPGVRAARETVDFQVFGGFEPAVLIAMSLADKIGIVTVLDNVMPLLRDHIMEAHLDRRIVSVRSVDIPVLALEDHNKLVDSLVEQSTQAIEIERVEAIVLGCTGMLDVALATEQKLKAKGYDVPIIEPGQAAMILLEVFANMGYKPSRITYGKLK